MEGALRVDVGTECSCSLGLSLVWQCLTFADVGALLPAMSSGMAIQVPGGGDLGLAIADRNRRSSDSNLGAIRTEVRAGVLQGRALVSHRRLAHDIRSASVASRRGRGAEVSYHT